MDYLLHQETFLFMCLLTHLILEFLYIHGGSGPQCGTIFSGREQNYVALECIDQCTTMEAMKGHTITLNHKLSAEFLVWFLIFHHYGSEILRKSLYFNILSENLTDSSTQQQQYCHVQFLLKFFDQIANKKKFLKKNTYAS